MFLLLLLSWLSGLSWLSWLAQAVEVKSVPPAPVRVLLKSSNMNHMLRWDRGPGTAPGVTYSVSFHIDRDPCCTVVPGCERVVERLLCNLTEAFSDPDKTYRVRVTAQLGFEQSSSPWLKLSPLRDTELQLPVLQLVHCGSSLCVDMEAPVPALYSIYDSFWYELKIQVDSEQPTLEPFMSLKRRKVQPVVKAGSRYCLSIRLSDELVPRESNFSDPQCVDIHSPIPAERPLAVVAALLVLLLLVFLALVYSGCICLRRQALPSVLTSVRHLEKRLMVFFHPPVSSLSIIKQAAPSYGQTECCSSESDYSEDEGGKVERRGDANAASYTSKGSLCSALSLSSSAPHSNTARKGGAEQERTEKMERAEEERTERAEEERTERAEEERTERAEEERTERAEEERTERAEEGLRMDGAEEVNLLTLTFSRDTDLGRDSAVVVSETELPVWAVEEEQQEPEECFEEECCQSGYMSR